MNHAIRHVILALSILLGLTACGGGGGTQPRGIGPDGGTVTGTNGATIVVPAGALSSTVDLGITEIDASSASLPAGIRRLGAVYELTPHGTNFAAPVTVTVPFDPAQVSAGRSVQALKTTDAALTSWGVVADPSVSGTTLSVEVSSFSNILPAAMALPAISTQPSDQTVLVGQSATFTVVAGGNGGPFLTYQWRRNGVALPGATASSYTLAQAAAIDAGAEFSVVVGNGLGSVTSGLARLQVSASSATGWVTLGGQAVVSGSPVRLGALAVAPNGRVGVAYVVGSSGTSGLVGELRVSEWDGTSWTQIGGALNLTANDGVSLSRDSLAYDNQNRPVVAWLDRFTSTLVVQRLNGAAWARLGNPMYSGGAATGDPQVLIDPITDRPIVVIRSGPYVNVRAWTGSAWSPADSTHSAIALGGGSLVVSASGGRQLAIAYGADTGGTQLLARLYTPDPSNGQYTVEASDPILPTAIRTRDFLLQVTSAASATPNAYALIGDTVAGPMLVRVRSGPSGWQSIGDDLGIRGTRLQLRVTPLGLPLVGYLHGSAPPHRVDGKWWDGAAWNQVTSPSATTEDVISFALGLAGNGLPYVAMTARDPNSASRLADQLVVRRFSPVTLSIAVAGPVGSGSVVVGAQSCAAGNTCDVPVPGGATLTLDAVPSGGSSFQSWVGCDAVNGTRCTVLVDQNKTVTATLQ
jgi:hypothetical protein